MTRRRKTNRRSLTRQLAKLCTAYYTTMTPTEREAVHQRVARTAVGDFGNYRAALVRVEKRLRVSDIEAMRQHCAAHHHPDLLRIADELRGGPPYTAPRSKIAVVRRLFFALACLNRSYVPLSSVLLPVAVVVALRVEETQAA